MPSYGGITNVSVKVMTSEERLLHFPPRIYPQKDEEQDGEAPEGGTAVTEEGQRNSDYGSEPEDHSDVDKDMEKQDAQYTISIYARVGVRLPFGEVNEAQDERKEKQEHGG